MTSQLFDEAGRTLLESIQERNVATTIEGVVRLGKVIEALIPYPEALLAVARFPQSWSHEKLREAIEQTDGINPGE